MQSSVETLALTFGKLGCYTTALITVLAPNLDAFRAMHIAHQSFRVTAAQQYMVRCSWRTSGRKTRWASQCMDYVWRLPSGRFDGVCVLSAYDNGAYRGRRYYVNGKRTGDRKRWHLNGQIWLHCTYSGDKRHGKYMRWYNTGCPSSLCTFVNGERHGDYKEWFSNERLSKHVTFVNDALHSEYRVWFSDGQLYKQATYVNGMLHGEHKIWQRNGLLASSMYNRGVLVEELDVQN